jgi:SAM-dependent methyltransferase
MAPSDHVADPTKRFSDRVEHYVRSRPGYPESVLDHLAIQCCKQTGFDGGWSPGATVADIGSGTGISAELFLRRGNRVYGVEPNLEMRQAAERLLAGYPQFASIAGTSEATTLPDAAVDFVVAGQAFHWFQREPTRREFARILKPGGWCVLLWNTRKIDATPFMRGYEQIVREFAIDYAKVRHENIDVAELEAFFDPGTHRGHVVANHQRLDAAGFQARLASSSYLPGDNHPQREAMYEAAAKLVAKHAENGQVTVDYDTEIHLGRITDSGATGLPVL